jgi:hypothetical protein
VQKYHISIEPAAKLLQGLQVRILVIDAVEHKVMDVRAPSAEICLSTTYGR